MSAVLTPRRHKLSVDDYHKLSDAGVFAPDARVELIDGELIDMAPVGGPHIRIVNRLNRLLVTAVGTDAEVSVQNPITLPPGSEPQPDLSLVRFGTGVPTASEVLLVIEVADSTLTFDRAIKLPLYARAAIPEVWIVDVNAQAIEIYRDPMGDGFQLHWKVGLRDSVLLLALPRVTIAVASVFAP